MSDKTTTSEGGMLLRSYTQELEKMKEYDESSDINKALTSTAVNGIAASYRAAVARDQPLVGTSRVADIGEPPVVPTRRIETRDSFTRPPATKPSSTAMSSAPGSSSVDASGRPVFY